MAKVMISLPDDLLGRIDSEVQRRGTSRSGLLRIAVERELGRLSPEEFDAIIERSRARFAKAGGFDSAELIRADRDARNARDRRRL